MQELFNELINWEEALSYVNYISLAFLVEAVIILWIGKKVNDLTVRYSVDDELTNKDNKALAVSYVGYLIGQAIIVLSLISGPAGDWVEDLISVAFWSLVGILLLNIARICNDRLVLRRFSNVKEIIGDKNVGVGAVQAGAYIGTAMLIGAIVAGNPNENAPGFVGSLAPNLVGVVIFFIIGQLSFVIFSLVYEKITTYRLHDELERDNIAAGVSFGMTLIAVGAILANPVHYTASIPAFFAWFITGAALIILTRFLVDKMLLPGHKLSDEIASDANWGVALVEGSTAVMVAFLLNASFA